MPFTSYFLVQEIMEIHDLLEEKCSFKTLAEKMAQICGIKLQEMGKGKLGRQSTYFIFCWLLSVSPQWFMYSN